MVIFLPRGDGDGEASPDGEFPVDIMSCGPPPFIRLVFGSFTAFGSHSACTLVFLDFYATRHN
jgi:hypothetical protein